MIEIDGKIGGGQVLRAALALSAATGKPFHMTAIRAMRTKPGLMRQHLLCARACAELCGAEIRGDEIGSSELFFEPGETKPRDALLEIGSGGSTALVLQAVMPAAARSLKAGESVRIRVTGGTYCLGAPSPEFLVRSLEPALRAMGYRVSFRHAKPGFWMTAGGELEMTAEGPFEPRAFESLEPAETSRVRGRVLANGLAPAIPEREITALGRALARLPEGIEVDVPDAPEPVRSAGPGSAVIVEAETSRGTAVFTSLARFGASAERVAEQAAKEAASHIESGAPVERRLADQLLVPMTLAAGGAFLCTTPTAHMRSCAEVIRLFTGKALSFARDGKLWRADVPAAE